MARRRYQDPAPKLRKGKSRWTWYFSYRVDVIKDGRIVREQVAESFPWEKKSCDTVKLAQRIVDDRMEEIQSPDYRARPDASFIELAEKWEKSINPTFKPSTQAVNQSYMRNHLKPYFGKIKLKDLNAMMLQEFATNYPGKPKTIRNLVALLSGMWRTAQDWGYVSEKLDPFERLKYRTSEQDEQASFTEQQMRLIIQQAKDPQKLIFWLAAETGMRSGELLGVRIEDIGFDSFRIYVKQSVWNREEQSPKTANAVRKFGISAALASALREKAGNRTGLVFCTKEGRAWDYSTTLEHLHSVLRRLWIPQCGFHAFRHGNASVLDGLNTPIKTRMSRLGHGSSLMTERYTHSQDLNDRRVAEQLGSMFAPMQTEVVQ